MSNNIMISFRNKKLDDIRKNKQIDALSEKLRVINLAKKANQIIKLQNKIKTMNDNKFQVVRMNLEEVVPEASISEEVKSLILELVKDEETVKEAVKEDVKEDVKEAVEEDVKEDVKEVVIEEANMTSFKQYLNRLNSKK